jgi:hypothetical protein
MGLMSKSHNPKSGGSRGTVRKYRIARSPFTSAHWLRRNAGGGIVCGTLLPRDGMLSILWEDVFEPLEDFGGGVYEAGGDEVGDPRLDTADV